MSHVGRYQHFLGWLYSHGAWDEFFIRLYLVFMKFDPENLGEVTRHFKESCVCFFKCLVQTSLEMRKNCVDARKSRNL